MSLKKGFSSLFSNPSQHHQKQPSFTPQFYVSNNSNSSFEGRHDSVDSFGTDVSDCSKDSKDTSESCSLTGEDQVSQWQSLLSKQLLQKNLDAFWMGTSTPPPTRKPRKRKTSKEAQNAAAPSPLLHQKQKPMKHQTSVPEVDFLVHDWVDVAAELDRYSEDGSDVEISFSNFPERLQTSALRFIVGVAEDFKHTRAELEMEEKRLEPRKAFSVRKLQKNVNRIRDQARPYLELLQGLIDIVLWRQPLSTLALFIIFIQGICSGWLTSYFLFLVLFQLTVNYFKYNRGYGVDLYVLPWTKLQNDFYLTRDLYEVGVQYLHDILLIAQELVILAADLLEKFKNLVTWRQKRLSAIFYAIVWSYFLLSVFCSMSTFFMIVGLHLCVNTFVNLYLYFLFPRLRHRIDVVTWLFDRLKTDEQFQWPKLPRVPPHRQKPRLVRQSSVPDSIRKRSFDVQITSRELELPLPKAKPQFRGCFLVDKSRTFPWNVVAGAIAIDDGQILFKFHHGKQYGIPKVLKIPFADIVAVSKSKVVSSLLRLSSFIPGQGMGIEVRTKTINESYLFAGILHRDKCFHELMTKGMPKSTDWVSPCSRVLTKTVVKEQKAD